MHDHFVPNLRPTLIGSLPMDDHSAATRLIFDSVPEIPLWAQLPAFREEGMVAQFLPGFPGAGRPAGKNRIDAADSGFADEVVAFYEDYLAVTGDPSHLEKSRFALGEDTARGFFEFIRQAPSLSAGCFAVKGQITGPFTFATSLVDSGDRAVFYDDQLRDMAVKLIALFTHDISPPDQKDDENISCK